MGHFISLGPHLQQKAEASASAFPLCGDWGELFRTIDRSKVSASHRHSRSYPENWDLQIKELQEKEAIQAMLRSAVSSELAGRKAAAIKAERLILQSVRFEVKRLLR
jgi:hypothetical protein